MAITMVSNQTATSAISVQVTPDGHLDWSPKTDEVCVLFAYYEPGVTAVGPSGWTMYEHQSLTVFNHREVAFTAWWYRLDRDYDGWRTDGGPVLPGVEVFELPAVTFDRSNEVDLFLYVQDSEDPSAGSTTLTITDGPLPDGLGGRVGWK